MEDSSPRRGGAWKAPVGQQPPRFSPCGIPSGGSPVPQRVVPVAPGLRGGGALGALRRFIGSFALASGYGRLGRGALLVVGLLAAGSVAQAQTHSSTTYTGSPFNFCLPGYDSFDYQDCWDFNWAVLNSSMSTLQDSNTAAITATAIATTAYAGVGSSFTLVGASTKALDVRVTTLEVWQGTSSPRIAAHEAFMSTSGPKVDALQVWQGTSSAVTDSLQVWKGTASPVIDSLQVWKGTASIEISALISSTASVYAALQSTAGALTAESVARAAADSTLTTAVNSTGSALTLETARAVAAEAVLTSAVNSTGSALTLETAARVAADALKMDLAGGVFSGAVSGPSFTATTFIQAGTFTVTNDGNNIARVIAQTGAGQIAGLSLQRGTYIDNFTDYSWLDEGGTLTLYSYANSVSTPIYSIVGQDKQIFFNGFVLAPASDSTSEPGFGFANDTNTGLMSVSNNVMALVSGGIKSLWIEDDEVVVPSRITAATATVTSTMTAKSYMFSDSTVSKLTYDGTNAFVQLMSAGGHMIMLDVNNGDSDALWFTKNGYSVSDPNLVLLGGVSQGAELWGFATLTSSAALFGTSGGLSLSNNGPTLTPVSEVSLENRGNMRQQNILYMGNQTVQGSSDPGSLAGPSPLSIGIYDGGTSWGHVIISTGASATSQAGIVLAKTRDVALGGSGNTIVVDGDLIGGTYFYGSDGVDYAKGAAIEASVDGTPGSNDMPMRVSIKTTPDGSQTPVERIGVESEGQVLIGTSAVAGKGNLRVRAGTGLGGGTTPIRLYQWFGSSNTAVGGDGIGTNWTMLAHSFTVPANTLVNDGDQLRVYAVAMATTSNISKGMWCEFNGDAVETNYNTTTNELFHQDNTVWRTSSTNMAGRALKVRSNNNGSITTVHQYDSTITFDATAAFDIECFLRNENTKSTGVDVDMDFVRMEVWYDPAP